jgi:hypothetical protein
MDIENDQIINIAEDDAAVDSTYVVVSIILIFLFGLGLCATAYLHIELLIYIQIYFVRIYIRDPEWPSSNLTMMSEVAIHGRS